MALRDALEQRRVSQLADAMQAQIGPGVYGLKAPISEVNNIDRWRRAARIVGRRLGWRTRTGVTERFVWVVNEDAELPEGFNNDQIARTNRMIRKAARHWLRIASTVEGDH